MKESESIELGKERLIKDQPEADLNNFKVKVIDHPTEVEIALYPKMVPLKETNAYTLGGRNKYGRSVSYFIDKETHQIVRHHYYK